MNIFVTRKIPEEGITLLKKHHHVVVSKEDRVLSKREIIKQASEADGLLCLLTDTIDQEVISSLSNLKMISNYAVGYNNIDISYATSKNIPVSNTPDVLTEATAELVWALIFAVSRRIVEADSFSRQGKFDGWGPMLLLGQDVSSKTLGVIGAGRIGTAMAQMSKGFKMDVLYVDHQKNPILEKKLNAKKTTLNNLLKTSDIISIHVPLTKETKHVIGKKEFSLMKKTAILINTSRGPVIDELALIDALKNNLIFGAGIDVYENEPNIPTDLKMMDNVVLLPHIGSATKEARTNMSIMAAENLITGLKGEKPAHCINLEVFD